MSEANPQGMIIIAYTGNSLQKWYLNNTVTVKCIILLYINILRASLLTLDILKIKDLKTTNMDRKKANKQDIRYYLIYPVCLVFCCPWHAKRL